MIVALYLLSAVATALAWALAQRKAEHRPIAYLLTAGLGADVARRILRTLYLGAEIKRLGPDVPWTGWPRVAATTSHALFLAWPASLASAALVVFLRRHAWPPFAVYVAAVAAIVVFHPIAGNGSLGRAFTAAQLASVAVSIGCGLTWYLGPSKPPTSTAQTALSLIVGVELTTIAFAWRRGIFTDWHLTQAVYVVLYAVLIIMQGGLVWQSNRSP
jgi:hypothetical protein